MNLVIRSNNLSVGEKSDRLLKAQKHLESARAESKHYNECKDCEEKWKSSETSEGYRGPMHYSFVLPSNFITLPMRYSRVLFSLRQLGDARFLGYAVSLSSSK